MRKTFLALLICGAMAAPAFGQSRESFDAFRERARAGFDAFKDKSKEDFEAFRKKINEDYASFLETAWKSFEQNMPKKAPEEPKPVPPVVFTPEPEGEPTPEPKPIEIKRVIKAPTPSPKPQPIVPLGDDVNPNFDLIPIKGSRPVKPKIDSPKVKLEGNKGNLELSGPIKATPAKPRPVTMGVSFLGTPLNVRWDKSKSAFRLPSTSEKDVAATWKILSDGRADDLLRDCLDLRDRLELTDWAYLRLLADVGAAIAGKDSNEAALLTAWLYCQSGYKMRMATGQSGRLYLLYASDHTIYNVGYYNLNGVSFYPYDCSEKTLSISSAKFPKEQPLSLIIAAEPRLSSALSEPRTLTSRRYSEATLTSRINRNLLDFYSSYPTSYIGGDIMSRWAMYANVPASDEITEFVYPALTKAIEGKDKRRAAEVLLNWVQTAFPYEYDENVWGGDRAFFADETLFYAACDCEDRSILFSRLVRDLLDLDVVLVYYPGHLATAVAFNESEPQGDYLTLNGRQFTICDPTYINAGTGRTMPGMDNTQAQVILLNH